ncbi:MAG TPA: M20/M25/M40 family metallo-hydrolase [Actinomycetota bacterium]|nr:M20/M25/M40 family metallo-hydrolase [Actinomycetota bacterium]
MEPPTSPPSGISVLAGLLISGCLLAITVFPWSVPAAKGENEPPEEFSAGRAFRHVTRLSRSPRVSGTEELAEARQYILGRLDDMGLETAVQTTVGAHRRDNRLLAASVSNVVGRIRGTSTGKSLLLVAHYDSVPTGPGAADDAAGVATLLETARAVQEGPAPRNDLIFLFTDGEEPCLCGARAFVEEHPWAPAVAAILNFEARGNRGAVLMYETSGDNRDLVAALGRAGGRVVASSIGEFFYRLSGSDTDLSVFRSAGIPGMNFAFLGGIPAYHTRIDTPDRLDLRSLQHLGAYSLPLARTLGDSDLDFRSEGNAVYFSVLGRLVSYPQEWRFAIVLLACAGFLAVATVRRRTGPTPWRPVLWGFLWLPLAVAAATGAAMAAWTAVRLLHPAKDPIVFEYQSPVFWSGLAILSFAMTVLVYLGLRRRGALNDLFLGSMMWWVVLAGATAVFLPAGSYLFAWPALFTVGALAISEKFGRDRQAASALVLGLGASLSVLVFAPAAYGLTQALGLFLVFAFPPVIVLLVNLLLPQVAPAVARFPRAIGLSSLALGLAVLGAGFLGSDFDEDHPRVEGFSYVLNADSSTAAWVTSNDSPSPWMEGVLGRGAEVSELDDLVPEPDLEPMLHGPAPVTGMAETQLAVSTETRSGNRRLLSVRLTPPREAARITLTAAGGGEVLGLSSPAGPVPVGELGSTRRTRVLEFAAPPPEGIEVTISAPVDDPVELTARTAMPKLPSIPVRRPESTMPGQHEHFVDDWSYVVRTFRIPAGSVGPG